jgi:NADH:ubiquinone oxidoreductase subunit F (NADH-binding)
MPSKNDILSKISAEALIGRGGASFPVAQKWAAVKAALRGKKTGYIVINGAEGEPGVDKDGYIINNYPEEVINGILVANNFLGKDKIKNIYFFLNHEYYHKYSAGLKKALESRKYSNLAGKLIFIVKQLDLTYISGEETALLNLIEGKKIEPRLKPPYPTTQGLFGKPTLVNNTETFYNVSLVSRGAYRHQRFYTVTGAVRRRGVYQLPDSLTIREVLEKTGNLPDFKFFVQVGGGAAGEVLHFNQLDRLVGGVGSVMVYDALKTDHIKLIRYWLNFFHEQSCGQCTACREGTYRLWEIINADKFNEELFKDLIDFLDEASLCYLGRSLPVPIRSYFSNILRK